MKKGTKKVKINRKRMAVSILAVLLVVIGSVGLYATVRKNLKEELEPLKEIHVSFEDHREDLLNFSYQGAAAVGWLQVQGTNVNFPVLNYFLTSDAKETQYVSSNDILEYAWRSPNYVTGENRETILGHNLVNLSSTPIRDMSELKAFEGLMAFVYEDFAQENLYISYTKGENEYIYKIYAIGFDDYDVDDSSSFKTEEVTKDYIDRVRKNSIYDYDIDVNEKDTLLSLKTCTRYFGVNQNQEFTIDARLLREGEKIEAYRVTKSENYKALIKNSDV